MKQMICLLILFFVFAKYGEPKATLMSLQGDVNLVMLETSLDMFDTIGFMYDDQFGGFAINPTYCPLWSRAPGSLIVRQDCSVRPHSEFSETPTDQHYRARHYPNYPSRGSGTNFIIGYRGSNSSVTTTVSKDKEVFAFTDVNQRIKKKLSQVYCNDKNYGHYKSLFNFEYNDYPTVVFNKNNRNKYQQTMKCIAILKNPKNILVAARLFTVIISNLEHRQFSFQASGLGEQSVLQGASSRQFTFNNISGVSDSLIETTFVFRTDVASGCPPKITMQPTSEEKQGLLFFYNVRALIMPKLEADDSHNCGIAVGQLATGGQSLFRYWCECKELP